MYRRNDPRFRRALNDISHTIESANESAQTNIFAFSHNYVNPCFSGIKSCFQPCVEHCFPARDERARRNRRSRGRAELNFDFYDDWENDEADGLLGWDDEEYDGLLSGSGGYGTTSQPGRQRAMSYGARRDAKGRRKSGVPEAGPEATGVPASTYYGFLGKLTGKLGGGKVLRYKPSAADLQEHPGVTAKLSGLDHEPLMEESEGDERRRRRHGRTRSGTAGSGNTTDSFSSRGDIFPSEDELDDATELDDEFAMVLERRNTNNGLDEASSGKTGKTRPNRRSHPGSRTSINTLSSRSTRSKRSSRIGDTISPMEEDRVDDSVEIIPSLTELKQEEAQAQRQEEADIAQRREAAQKLAEERGLSAAETPQSPSAKSGNSQVDTASNADQIHSSDQPSESEVIEPSDDARPLTAIELSANDQDDTSKSDRDEARLRDDIEDDEDNPAT